MNVLGSNVEYDHFGGLHGRNLKYNGMGVSRFEGKSPGEKSY